MKICGVHNSVVCIKVFTILVLVVSFGYGCSSPLEEQKEIFNLRIFPSTLEMVEGSESLFQVWVDQADGLIATRFTLSFDPAYFEVVNLSTSGIDFLFSDAAAEVIEIEKNVDNENGLVTIGIGAQSEGFTGALGSGSLAVMLVKAKKTGESDLRFVDNKPDDIMTMVYSVSQETGWKEIDVETFNSTVTIIEKSAKPAVSQPAG